jgi:hypothetical protein
MSHNLLLLDIARQTLLYIVQVPRVLLIDLPTHMIHGLLKFIVPSNSPAYYLARSPPDVSTRHH